VTGHTFSGAPKRHAAAPAWRPLRGTLRIALATSLLAGTVLATSSWFGLLWFVPYASVGTLLAARRPRNVIGWLLLAVGWCFAITVTTVDTTAAAFSDGTVTTVDAALGLAEFLTGSIAFGLLAILAVLLPDGSLPRRRWGSVGQLVIAGAVLVMIASAVMPVVKVNIAGAPTSVAVRNPIGVVPGLPLWTILNADTALVANLMLLATGTTALVARHRRATGIERQQLRWILASIAFIVVAVLGGFVVAAVVPGSSTSGLAWVGAVFAFPGVPVAIGVAVMRYRLYDIDRIISRTIAWLAVTFILAAVFAGAVVGLQAVLAPATGRSTLAVAVSTLVAAALFQPLRRMVQGAVDRRFDRARYDGERVVASFSGQLRHQVDLDELTDEVRHVADETVRPVSTAIWLRNATDRARSQVP
jgi:hypothetical protein